MIPEVTTEDFVKAVAAEMASGIDCAVECWMAQVDQALEDRHLTTLGRMNAIKEVVQRYKHLTGKQRLERRGLPEMATTA